MTAEDIIPTLAFEVSLWFYECEIFSGFLTCTLFTIFRKHIINYQIVWVYVFTYIIWSRSSLQHILKMSHSYWYESRSLDTFPTCHMPLTPKHVTASVLCSSPYICPKILSENSFQNYMLTFHNLKDHLIQLKTFSAIKLHSQAQSNSHMKKIQLNPTCLRMHNFSPNCSLGDSNTTLDVHKQGKRAENSGETIIQLLRSQEKI